LADKYECSSMFIYRVWPGENTAILTWKVKGNSLSCVPTVHINKC